MERRQWSYQAEAIHFINNESRGRFIDAVTQLPETITKQLLAGVLLPTAYGAGNLNEQHAYNFVYGFGIMLHHQLKIPTGIFENGVQLQECICECINSLYLNPSKDGLQNFVERTVNFGVKPATKRTKSDIGLWDNRHDKRAYHTQINFLDIAEAHYSGWANVPDHYNNIQDLPRVPLKVWKRKGNSSTVTLKTTFISLKSFAIRLTNAINGCEIHDLKHNPCSTFEEKWNMIMAAFGGFYIEAVGLKDLIFSKASKVINRISASVAWNTLGVRGGNIPEKVRIQYSVLLGVPHMLKRCTNLYGSFRNTNPRNAKGLKARAIRA